MAISRMNMERQMRNMGGIMGLEDQRQGYFLGKLVKKITKPIKKIVKSPLGKAALFAAAANFAPALFGRQTLLKQAGGLPGIFDKIRSGEGMLGQLGNIFRVGGEKDADLSLFRVGGGLLGATALAAPFLMGGEEEEVDEESFTGPISSIESIRDQARQYYGDPTNSALYFMPPKSAVRSSFYAADGGLADIPRGGYKEGESVISKQQAAMIEDMQDKGMDMSTIESLTGLTKEQITNYLSSLNQKAEGGIMDLGGMEKDYREGGFVPIGAEERADDVPARLSKNEFVFTADAVRNAGGGDIDKGAEVMQNMMDNLEAGGTISEESQGKENPAQAMFDQAQMMESRIV